MKILFVDDSYERRKAFLASHPLDEVLTAETSANTINILSETIFLDEIYLDHDLGHIQDESNRAYDLSYPQINITIKPAIEWLIKWRGVMTERCPKIIIHSHNTVEAQKILADLLKAGYSVVYEPFEGAP